LDLFKTHSAKEAHIVKNANGRSKGFGFVEFSTEDSQKAALTATDNILTVERRTLLVKIALTDNNAAGADAAPQEKKEEKTA
jgi:RNA recognition motif-containing protein